jgi:hypothetical protein
VIGVTFLHVIKQMNFGSVEALASQFAALTAYQTYSLHTKQGHNMDCLKAIKLKDKSFLGVYHT